MQNLVETTLEAPAWDGLNLPARATQMAQETLCFLGFDPQAYEISLLGCDDARIAVLNTEFRGKPLPTNVLSWPSQDRAPEHPGGTPLPPTAFIPGEVIELGDIAIALETCQFEAKAAGRAVEDHVCHLLVHGILHLLGYDHEADEDAVLMEGLETEILAQVGIADPYAAQGGLPDEHG